MTEFFTITLIIMLAAISPGPDFALVAKNSIQYTRQDGIFTSLGVSCSLLIHSFYCILGLAIIISQSLLMFSIIQYLGAAYLIYIGAKSVLAKRNEVVGINARAHNHTLGAVKAFTQGLLCNLLNPKAIMFILAFFTVIMKPATPWIAQSGYGLEIALIHLLWFSWLAIMITHHRVKENLSKIEYYVVKVMGFILIGFGAHIAFIHQLSA